MKLPVPVNGSRMWTSLSASVLPNSAFRILSDAGDHEVDERLRRIDDAVRVGHLHAEALKEPLIDGVEEVLLFVKVGDGGGGVFNRAVEMVQALAEIVAAEGAGVERGDDLFNLRAMTLRWMKSADVENLAERCAR